jgi:hypothetical protein
MLSDILPVAHLMAGEEEFCDCAKNMWKCFLDEPIVSFGHFSEIACGKFCRFFIFQCGFDLS